MQTASKESDLLCFYASWLRAWHYQIIVLSPMHEHGMCCRFAEAVITVLFTILVALWFFRDPDFMTGWATRLKDGYAAG